MAVNQNQKVLIAAGGVSLVALYVYRKNGAKKSGGSTTVVSPVSTSGSVAPYTPQQPVTLQAGESVYNPNNNDLLTTPSDNSGAAQSAVAAAPSYTPSITYSPVFTTRAAKTAATKQATAKTKTVAKTTKPKTVPHVTSKTKTKKKAA
jgi:hypothetical protein